MPMIKIAAETLLKVREKLVKTAAVEKLAETLRQENDVLRRTMQLVASGHLDPEVALDKVADYNANPDALRAAEAVSELGGIVSTKIGTTEGAALESDDADGGSTPEARFASRLASITNHV